MSDEHHDDHQHHILPNKISLKVLLLLLIATIITVIASRINFGAWNFPLAMLIATLKALMVVLFFMGLKYDTNENRIIFGSAFAFLMIFVVLTSTDLFSRGDIWVKGPVFKEVTQTGGTKFKKPWVASEELIKHGEKLFRENQQCTLCHGNEGHGDGVAAAGLNPKPRDFTLGEGWKNGRKPSQVFQTITKGLGLMPSFSAKSEEERWALTHYVLSLGLPAPQDTPQDLKALSIDPTQEDGGKKVAEVKKTIPIEFAIERYLQTY